ncbi:hypothetical protein [Enterococcus faecium]|uniref:hypothetical protein n=1 Tax=Enterococcus faecium TaxID=1352 RepID=UPI000BF12661|nr:hypothetical protein [Enterococcus faecium]PEH49293.1 hypothetical protein CRM75_16065 [Enterococcus faecium]
MDISAFFKKGTTITISGVASYLLNLPTWLYVFLGILVFLAFLWHTWINAPERYWKSYDKRHIKK